MTLTVYAICWNEIFLLPHFFKHYDFADRIIIYDNGSDDGSQEFVLNHPKGVLHHYDTNGQQDNVEMKRVKNTCWKGDSSDWVIVCDVDEFVIGFEKLINYKNQLVVFDCYNWEIVYEEVPTDFSQVNLKFHHTTWSSKCLCFNPRIRDIHYGPGCHWCFPKPKNIIKGVLEHYHYVALSEDYMVQRWKRYVPRMSENDHKMGWASYYLMEEEKIRQEYRRRLSLAQRNS